MEYILKKIVRNNEIFIVQYLEIPHKFTNFVQLAEKHKDHFWNVPLSLSMLEIFQGDTQQK